MFIEFIGVFRDHILLLIFFKEQMLNLYMPLAWPDYDSFHRPWVLSKAT